MRILVSDKLSKDGLKILKDEKSFTVDVKTGLNLGELKSIIKDYHAIIVRSGTKLTREVIESADNLKVIGRAGVGLDNIDLEAATSRGIIVMNTPAGNTISTAEHTMSMILALARNIPQAYSSIKSGQWQRSKFMGVELYGKTLGIVGLGRIGIEVAKRALSFGMRVITYDPFLSEEKARQTEVEPVNFKELLSSSDYISVHTPLTEETKHMISVKEFKMMKDGIKVINCARGGIIDEEALIEAVKSGKVAGAALDVYESEPLSKDSPLLKLNNIILTPHLGASTQEAQVNVAIEIAQAVKDALLNKGIRNAANFPCLEAEARKILAPWINLSEKIGLLAGQILTGRIKEVEISYSGMLTQHEIKPLSLALIKGLLFPILQETVNYVNSLSLAKERGIKIREQKSQQDEEFTNLISLQVKTDKESKSIVATVLANNLARIVKIDQFYVEAIPKGHMIITYNWDKPGIIGALGTLLGRHNINIAGMTFGRESAGGRAISVLNIDSCPSHEILQKINKLDNILAVKAVKL